MVIIVLWILCLGTMVGSAQNATPITGADVLEDVIDHSRFDSLWRASKRFGRLSTNGVYSQAYLDYRKALATAHPDQYLPDARIAFWVNAYLALLMEAMNNRLGYRYTIWDSLYLHRDTARIAQAPFTLQQLADTIAATAGKVAIRAFLCTGSSSDPPYPAHALYAKTVTQELRIQLRKLVRSERFVLYDPAGNVLQLATMFMAWQQGMVQERGSAAEYLLPWFTEEVAAQVALRQQTLVVQYSDRIEVWKHTR